jgi:hypothetical protein
MSKFTLVAASAVLGAVTIIGAARQLSAETAIPSDHMRCYYSGGFCSYPGTAYWSDCNPSYPAGFIRTDMAEIICRTFHEGTAW